MSRTQPDRSPPVRIEAENEWAWCGDRRLELTPKAFAVLRHLVEHAGRLITKDELLSTIWRDAIVSDAALASAIRDVRKALGDASYSPRYIQTVHRRGFRFIGPVARSTAAITAETTGPSSTRFTSSSDAASMLVGRESELAGLHARLAKALAGERQLVFVTGEPGIGKTTLVEAFLADVGEAGVAASGRDSAWSSTAPARPTCRCSRRWGDWDAPREANRSCRFSSSTRRPGWSSSRDC